MNFAFSEEQDEFRAMLRRFFEEKAPQAEVRRMLEEPEGYDPGLWKQMAEELGLQGVHVPEAYGGQGFGFLELAIVLEEMGRGPLPSPYFASAALATNAILNAGSEAQKRGLLPGLADGSEIASLALLEASGRWDVQGITAQARPEGDALRVSGVKELVMDGSAATRLVVVARLPESAGEEGVVLCTLASDAPGVCVELLPAMDPTRRQARVRLDGARAQPLGEPGQGFAPLRKTLLQAAALLSAEMVGGARRALDLAVEYAKVRVQFARPIGSFQAIKHKAAEVLLDLELARSAAYYAAWAADEDGPELAEAAHLAKATCAGAYLKAAAECIQIHGGIGFTWENDAHLHYKRAKGSDILLGDAAAQRVALSAVLGV